MAANELMVGRRGGGLRERGQTSRFSKRNEKKEKELVRECYKVTDDEHKEQTEDSK